MSVMIGPNGVNIRDDTLAQADEARIGLFQAGAAIPINNTCIIDTSVTTGKKVVPLTASGTANNEHLIRGVYEGEGGQGAVVTATEAAWGGKGRAALSGDWITLTTNGPARALVDGGTDITAGARLKAFTTAGVLMIDAALTSFPRWPVTAMEAYTDTADVGKLVYIWG